MSSIIAQPTCSRPTSRSRRSVVAAVVGGLVVAIGSVAAAAAIGLIAVFGHTGTIDSGRHQVATSAAAVVTDVANIQNTHGVGTLTGWPTIRMTASGGNPSGIFVGIGPADQVDRYLAGVAVDRIVDLSIRPFDLVVTRQPGSAHAAPPGQQNFWVASSSSRATADLDWQVRDGRYRLVIMNADGSTDFVTQAQVRLTLPNAFPIAVWTLVGGALVTGAGVVVLVLAHTRGRVSDRTARSN